jgi:hypothetical protein
MFNLTNDLAGWIFDDKGYLLNLDKLEFVQRQQQLHFAAKPRKAMKKPDLPLEANRWAKKRCLVETVIGQTKTVCNLEHTRGG